MAVLGYIDADQQVVCRSSYLTLQLTKEAEPAIIVLIHEGPPRKGYLVLAHRIF